MGEGVGAINREGKRESKGWVSLTPRESESKGWVSLTPRERSNVWRFGCHYNPKGESV